MARIHRAAHRCNGPSCCLTALVRSSSFRRKYKRERNNTSKNIRSMGSEKSKDIRALSAVHQHRHGNDIFQFKKTKFPLFLRMGWRREISFSTPLRIHRWGTEKSQMDVKNIREQISQRWSIKCFMSCENGALSTSSSSQLIKWKIWVGVVSGVLVNYREFPFHPEKMKHPKEERGTGYEFKNLLLFIIKAPDF